MQALTLIIETRNTRLSIGPPKKTQGEPLIILEFPAAKGSATITGRCKRLKTKGSKNRVLNFPSLKYSGMNFSGVPQVIRKSRRRSVCRPLWPPMPGNHSSGGGASASAGIDAWASSSA